AAYIKTWTGQQVGYPPNGGGSGLEHKSITFPIPYDFNLVNIVGYPFHITQCITFSGVAGDCDNSLFEILDVILENFHGTGASSYAAQIQSWSTYMDCCAASGGCQRVSIENMNVTSSAINAIAVSYHCDRIYNTAGFTCS
ncbi:glycoside hydrolase family 28 protein, partial [Cenococcum geophilum 1.58]|uniref:glycoside hydrolase family 28 protein n=1 Tax=Cenococcum geophilum 1.58 TaxID=794803 RepID=UPI00358FABE4